MFGFEYANTERILLDKGDYNNGNEYGGFPCHRSGAE